MRVSILLVAALVMGTVSANAQSLKETLFSGKLKSDSGTVVRKTDDLSTKIDSTPRKQVEQPKLAPPMTVDGSGRLVPGEVAAGTVAASTSTGTTTPATTTTTVTNADGTPITTTVPVAEKPKDNNSVWKAYIDEFTGNLRTEVLTNKKIKNGTYSVLIDYNIETDGAITINSVSSSPKSDYLEEQIKNRLTLSVPVMTPLLGTNGKPRKAANRKQMITLAK